MPQKKVSSSSLPIESLTEAASTISENLERMASRKSVKIPNTFIKKQGSGKIMQKIKSHKALDPKRALEATGNLASLNTNPENKTRQLVFPPLNSINEAKPTESTLNGEITIIKPPQNLRPLRSLKTPADQSKTLSYTSSSRTIVPPLLSPGKITRQNTIGPATFKKFSEVIPVDHIPAAPLSAERSCDKENLSHREFERVATISHNKENILRARRDWINRDKEKEKEKDLTEVMSCLQKLIELEQHISPTLGQDSRKQLDEVRNTVAVVVGSLTQLSQKLAL
jgi:hypothetical protein